MFWVLFLGLLAGQGYCNEYLLPGDVSPHHYDIFVTYDIDPSTNFSYFGVVNILLSAKKEAVSKIVLHAEDYHLVKNEITLQGPTEVGVKDVKLNDTYNLLTINLDRELMVERNYTLSIPFYGNLKAELYGVYISSYVDQKTQTKEYLVTTQFEAIYARKGFPCFDEPMYKATFRVVLGHHRDFTAIGNMPLQFSSNDNPVEKQWSWNAITNKFQKNKPDFIWDHFEISVPMSTYLVAYVISKFDYVESPRDLSTTKFRIWARKDAIDQTAYASTVGPKVLTHFEKWFNVSFPLPKQDMIAIPDFSAGAMENWGLITYRETALLYHKQHTSLKGKERVAEVIAHELAHQWFGNLVTMKWWSDLWLNEGFATFVASIGVDAVEPEWDSRTVAGIFNILSVLKLDALESSHPVSVPITDPKHIAEIFDKISYEKGSALIRTMTMFLGEDVFREAINKYLIKHSYKNAEQDDLWSELTEVSHKRGVLKPDVTVKEIMDTWTTQTGYPLLTVTRDYGEHSLIITQKRYLALSARSTTSSSWWVPLRVLSEREASSGIITPPLQWLAAHEGVTEEHKFQHDAAAHEWLLFNSDMIAPYRVNYDERNWQLLTNVLLGDKYTQIPIPGRVQLLSDAFALASTNRLDYSIPLKLANYLQHEYDYLPLSTALSALSRIDNILKRTPDYGAFQKYMRKLISATYMKTGGLAAKKIINGDNLMSVKMQELLSSWACRMKVPGCEENAMQLFQQWMDTPNPDVNNPIPLDLRPEVYCVGIARGSVRHWRFLLARKQHANVASARATMLSGLTCSKEVWILSQYLEWTVTDNLDVRRQDAIAVIVGVLRSNVGYYVAKDFIYNRIEDIHKAFNGQNQRIGAIVNALLDEVTTERELDEFMVWYNSNDKYLKDSSMTINQGIEKAKVNLEWITKNRKLVVDKMREYSVDHLDEMLFLKYSGDAVRSSQSYILHIFLVISVFSYK